MISHFDLTDTEFEDQFKNSELPASLFSHEAHLRLAWIHISKYGIRVAISNIRTQLKNYVKHLGAQDKYNETLTVAAIRAVYHFMLKTTAGSFKDFINNNPQLLINFKGLMMQHYTTDIFNSDFAKKNFIEPELLPFD